MVNDFMVYVDRMIASAACFESVNDGESEEATNVFEATTTTKTESGLASVKTNGEGSSSLKKVKEMVECRICQEEDEVHAMEAPCACNGTLKFAHRKCIQRWCNKKGNVTCEICNQIFSPNFSVQLTHSSPDVMTIDIRQAWSQHIDLHDSHLLALAAAERQFLQSDCEDYAVGSSSSIACIRSVALILLIILLLRQALMITIYSGMVQEQSTLFNVIYVAGGIIVFAILHLYTCKHHEYYYFKLLALLLSSFHIKLNGDIGHQFQVSLLQLAGFLLPCYVMARTWYTVQCRRRRQAE